MLSAGDRVVVAVSGGADSVALLRLLKNLQQELGISLFVAHFDHCLRAESGADATFVAGIARAHELALISHREDVAAEAARHGWNIEDAGRRLRYAFFERIVAEGRASRVAVAHTADDQAETVLARILRGTGVTGLAGIYPVVGHIVRPLLHARRADLRAYLGRCGDAWREDPTNRDTRRQRARIREKLLPLLEQEFSPSIIDRLSGLARLAREQETFWDALVEHHFRMNVRAAASDNHHVLSIDGSALLHPIDFSTQSNSPDRALTERIVRRLYQELRGDRLQLTARHVDQVIHLASKSSSGRRVQLPRGILVERNFGDIVFSHTRPAQISRRSAAKFYPETTAAKDAYLYTVDLALTLPGASVSVSVSELGSRFSLKVIDWPMPARETELHGEALDADLLRAPLILRNWRPGDSYRARGRRRPRKLKQMFLAARIPSRSRGLWPVLESDGRVVWARGLAPAGDFCVCRGSRAGVLIEETRIEAPLDKTGEQFKVAPGRTAVDPVG